MRKRAYNAIAFWGILAVLAGCGSEKVSVSEEIVLVEPVSGSVESQPVLYRNLYDGEVYSASVLPDIREYAFEESAEVERFVAFPGTQVEAGETLVYSDTESLEEEILDLEEQIAEMEKEFQEYKQDAETLLWEYQHDTENYEEMVDGLKEDEPEEYLMGADGEKTENPDYDAWEKEYTQLSGKYHKEELNAFMQEAELQQKTELYQLDHTYYLEKLEALKKNRENRILKTGAKGQVVAIAQTEYETVKAAANEAVVAVGDFSRKLLICDYLKKSRITKAEEIYALIAGKKIEEQYPCIYNAMFAGILVGLGLIPVLFYTYTGILGYNVDWLNIVMYIASVVIAYYVVYREAKDCSGKESKLLRYLMYALLLAFMIFTLYPPELGIFQSPV